MTPATCLPQPHQVVLSGLMLGPVEEEDVKNRRGLTARVACSLLAHVEDGDVIVGDGVAIWQGCVTA
jgi:hypothetical protein